MVLLVALCVAGFLLGQVQNRARAGGKTDFFTTAVRTVFQPVSSPIRAITERTGDWSVGFFSGSALVDENRRLKAQLQAVAGYQEQVDLLRSQVEEIRALQGFVPGPGKVRIPASIIGHFPFENLATLDVGSAEGVAVGSPVVSAQGLVGTVQSVEKKRCQVLLLTNAGVTIGAIDVSRKPPSAGLFRALAVTFQDPKAPVEVGDVITTSGFSERIPRGIVIGRVIFVDDSQEQGTRRAIVDPAVSIGEVREVMVLR